MSRWRCTSPAGTGAGEGGEEGERGLREPEQVYKTRFQLGTPRGDPWERENSIAINASYMMAVPFEMGDHPNRFQLALRYVHRNRIRECVRW